MRKGFTRMVPSTGRPLLEQADTLVGRELVGVRLVRAVLDPERLIYVEVRDDD